MTAAQSQDALFPMGHPPHTFAFEPGKKASVSCSVARLCVPLSMALCSSIVAHSAIASSDPPRTTSAESSGAPDDSTRHDPAHAPTLAELERELHEARPEKRRGAVKSLAELKSPQAWELVLKALVDPDPMVADEAELAIGRLRDRKLLPELYGRAGLTARDAWTRLRVAEALGRMTIEIDGPSLMRSVSTASSDVARMIVWSIERLAASKKLGGDAAKVAHALESLCRAKCDSGLRGAALQAWCAIDKSGAQPMASAAMSDRDPVLRCAGLRAALGRSEVECVACSRRLLGDPESAVRAQAIENLEHVSSKAAILALIDHMDVEKRQRLRYGILAFLQQRSGLAHGFDSAAWREWAETIAGAAATGAVKGARLGPIGDTHVSFAGLNLISDRIVFLIDCSGSLWHTKVGGRTRKEVSDAELEKALAALPPSSEFNLIPYTDEPIPFEKRLLPSRPDNVKRALEFFEHCHRSGRGNFYAAVELALSDPGVDTIVVLTDGVPTGGHRWNLDLMFDLIVEQNRYRKVAFDSILVDAPKSARKKWSQLAERTGGRSIEAKLE